MQALTNGTMKLSNRVININQKQLIGMVALAKDLGLKTVPSSSGNNLHQYRFYDKERKYEYVDRRYEKEYDLRYDKPSSWTIHPNFKLRMHFEEHAHLRGRSIAILTLAVFAWCAFWILAIESVPHPEAVGAEKNAPYVKYEDYDNVFIRKYEK